MASIAFGAVYLWKPDESEQPEDEPPAQSEERTEPDPSPELLALLDSVVYYGDKSQCRLTPEQADAFAAVLRQEMASLQAKTERNEVNLVADFCVALFDTGSGIPAMFCGGGMNYSSGWAAPDSEGRI